MGHLLYFLAVVPLAFSAISFPPQESEEVVPGAINLMVFYECPTSKINVEHAVKYINSQEGSSLRVGKVHYIPVESDQSDVNKLIQQLCNPVDTSMSGSHRPDFALDLTKGGFPSECVKVILKSLKIPTITGTAGQEGDISMWRELSTAQKGYLVQVAPPSDVMLQAIRSIASLQNMTNAAVLYKKDMFEMHHKNNTLFKNLIPERHANPFSRIAPQYKPFYKVIMALDYWRRWQLNNLVISHKDKISNIFVAASVNCISDVIHEASGVSRAAYFSKGFAWYTLSTEVGNPVCRNCSADATIVHISPKLQFQKNSPRKDYFAKAQGWNTENIETIFEFDLAVSSITAIRAAKTAGKTISTAEPISCANYKSSDAKTAGPDVNLYEELGKASEENLIPFNLEARENGKNYPVFRAKIEKNTFTKGREFPVEIEALGSWNSGFMEKEAIEFKNGKDLSDYVPDSGKEV